MMITNGHTYAVNKRNTICLIYTHDDPILLCYMY